MRPSKNELKLTFITLIIGISIGASLIEYANNHTPKKCNHPVLITNGGVEAVLPMPIQIAVCIVNGIEIDFHYPSWDIDYDTEMLLCNKLAEDIGTVEDDVKHVAEALNPTIK